MSSGTRAGREFEVEFNLTNPSSGVDPETLAFKSLGMLRTKDRTVTVGDIDTTADKSEGNFRTYIDNYKEGSFSLDGVCYGDVKYNQRELHNHVSVKVTAPEALGQARGYLRFTDPIWDQILIVPVKFDEAGHSGAYDDTVTFTITGKYVGEPIVLSYTP